MTKKSLIFMMALLLGACGYHLRGALDLPEGMKNVYVDGGSPPLREQFKRSLKSSAGKFANSPEGAGMIIKIFGEDLNRRALSLGSRGIANEFELYYRLEYELLGSGNSVLMPRQPVEIRRDYFNDQQDIMAKDTEEDVIRNEMYQQAVRTIVDRARVVLEADAK
ncbi:MAG: LPS assembly lipoprotein LptE [Methylobacter sp.]|uniref:LPS-assembly lipoprotein LptE n=1 Tax=Methylobacter sp. TaxID=2051955 RepID=UPI0025868640|nr:LPS assembly lipoprotein LptE [Methylobacter sp.]MCL7422723.1 LPS assembly lipoprotein LptE [Methylobacter sp.]